MGDDKTRGSGSIIGSEHGPVGHMVTHGRARLEQKEGKSSAETGIAPTGGVPHWRTLTKPELSGAEMGGLAPQIIAVYSRGELGSLASHC